MASKCNKFIPNIFNKAKCQHCFAAKEAHSAAALENNKASRKVTRCGYLFVSPGYDFSNPLDRTRRWQRRFFRLYDDGEFTYCVDENPDTVPQGVVDMNKCTDVLDAETTTTHPFSLSIVTPEKTVYVKGNSREEMQWWQETLGEFPKELKAVKPRRKQPFLILSNKENQRDATDGSASDPKQARLDSRSKMEGGSYTTFRGVRSLKHRYDPSYQEGLRKSSSLHDLSTEDQELVPGTLESSRFLSQSGDRLDLLSRDKTFSLSRTPYHHTSGGSSSSAPLSSSSAASNLPAHPPFTMPRSTWTRTGQPVPAAFLTPKASLHTQIAASSHSSISSVSSNNSSSVPNRRGSFDDRPSGSSKSGVAAASPSKLHRERSSSLKDFPTTFSLSASAARDRDSGDELGQHSMSADETESNETDELKDLVYMKKGWLIKQGQAEKDTKKHWFVLAGNSLRYYKDARAEEANLLDGRIDLSSCYEVSELPTHRNYGFKIKTGNGEYTLAAMTLGIRNNWMKAIRLCMELHSTVPMWKMASKAGSPLSSKSPPRASLDDLEFKSGAAPSSTAAVKGASGETTFQLVGRNKDPHRRETRGNARRHHSDVNPGNVSKVLSVKEFSDSIDTGSESTPSPYGGNTQTTHSADSQNVDRSEGTSRVSRTPRQRSPGKESVSRPAPSRAVASGLKRFVEGSDSMAVSSPTSTTSGAASAVSGGAAAQGPSSELQKTPMSGSKRGITSESNKEEVKREMMRRAKSPSARVKEKSRAGKAPALSLHSPATSVDEAYGFHIGSATASDAGSAMSDTADDPAYGDIPISEDEYHTQEDTDIDEVGSATASDVVGSDDALVEILETEVESLKDRLEHTQTELDKYHKDNMDLKSRLHKESSQSVDSGYSVGGRWGQSGNQSDMLKRQLKEARDTIQRQRLDIEGLKSKLDMSVSKLTGTEKALSEALKDYKQEKDKFLKLSSEWNRRIRTMEGQSKDNIHKLERNRETLQTKERECRRLEAEVKNNLQRTREQEREILKLKAVEHEYNQLKEKLDDREHEISNLRSELKEKDHLTTKMKEEYEQQLEEMDREYSQERDDLENHLEQLKSELYSAHDRQASLTDNMTSNMADMLKEKDDIIAQLEEKMIEADKKLVDLSEELHAEMGENADLAHTLEVLQSEKMGLSHTIDELEAQLIALRSKVSGFESDNFSLRRQLEELRQENTQLHDGLTKASQDLDGGAVAQTSSQGDKEKEKLKKTIVDLNKRIDDLQHQLSRVDSVAEKRPERSTSSLSSSISSDHHQDLLHVILLVDSQLKEVNTMLLSLRQNFDSYLGSVPSSARPQAIKLADLIEDVGHKCKDVQDTLRESNSEEWQKGTPSGQSDESAYKHTITVSPNSSGKVIMEEYKGLKMKFDQAVSELRRVKKELKVSSPKLADTDELKLKEKLGVMEEVYKEQIIDLVARVDNLTEKIVNVQTESHLKTNQNVNAANMSDDIEEQIVQLERKISSLEQTAKNIEVSKASDSATTSNAVRALEDVKCQLEQVNSKLTNVSSSLSSKMQSYRDRVGSLSTSLQSSGSTVPATRPSSSTSETTNEVAAAGVSNCLGIIREKVLEIAEQLDSIEEADEDSDSEDEGESTTVEDIRDKLAHLTEYIEQHSKLSSSDWALVRLMTLQKESVKTNNKDVASSTSSLSDNEKLKLYSDQLSLEAVLLSEMSHILQVKDCLVPEDTVCREIDTLNSQILNLHHKLDCEMKTMHFDNAQADLMASYAELVAEKVLVNGQLCSATFDQRSHLGKNVTCESSPSIQPMLLATEALLRSQVDAFICSNMDKSVDDILSLPTHLSSRALIQGEITHALGQLKSRLAENPDVLKAGPANYKFMFNRLLERQRKVFDSIAEYEKQLTNSLAVIIFKDSEEMTIVEGPESVLEAMCSDLSTLIETHIQHFKEKCRSAMDTHSARRFDIIVNELRNGRESVLSEIKSQHEAYAKDPTSVRDSSLDIPVQSLDTTISNFGQILSLKAIVAASTTFLSELMKLGDSVLADLELEHDSSGENTLAIEKGLTSFVNALSESLQAEALSKECLSRKLTACDKNKTPPSRTESEEEASSSSVSLNDIVLRLPDLSQYPHHLSKRAQLLVREAVHSAQLTFSLFKQKLFHDREINRLKARRPVRQRPDLDTEESRDSDDTLDLQTDFEALLIPLEEVLESKHEDEIEVLQVVLGLVNQIKSSGGSGAVSTALDEQLGQLEQKLQHELEVAKQRHDTHLEVFRQESGKLEKTLEEQQQDRDHYEERCAQLEDELTTLQLQHEEEKERVKQDILTAVHAIRSNDEKSETHLLEQASKLSRELNMQKINFRKTLSSLKKEFASKDKSAINQMLDEHIKAIALNVEEEHEEEYQPPLPSQPPPSVPSGQQSTLEEHSVEVKDSEKSLDLSQHEHEVEQLKKEKEQALAEEMRNTKAALDAVRSAYEDELAKERAKYKEALLTMYTEEYINEIRMRHQQDEERMTEELQKLNMHYSSKCEDYKLLEMRLNQTKQDYESHINQLIASNNHLEDMLNTEIDSLKDFIKNKPSSASLTTGSATMEEELYDAKIMVRVKDAELQKLRSQVKNLENSLHRTTEEQRQTMTQYMQTLKKSSEMKGQYQEEISNLTEKLNRVLGSQGLKANIRRTPSFHQRARSPSPETSPSPRKESDHSSRDSHRRRHIHPKDLRRSKSSPSLPYVFDGKGSPGKQASAKPGQRSRSPKT